VNPAWSVSTPAFWSSTPDRAAQRGLGGAPRRNRFLPDECASSSIRPTATSRAVVSFWTGGWLIGCWHGAHRRCDPPLGGGNRSEVIMHG